MKSYLTKINIIFAVAVVLLIATIVSLSRFFINDVSALNSFFALVLFLLTAPAISFLALFESHKNKFWILGIIAFAVILLTFPWNILQVISGLAVWASIVYFYRSAKYYLRDRLHFSYFKAVKKGMLWFFLSLVLLITLNVYIATANDLLKNPGIFYNQTADLIVRGAEPVIKAQMEGYNPQMALNEFLLESDYFSADNGNNIEQAQNRFFDLFQIEASGDEQIREVMFQVTRAKVVQIFEPVKRFIPLLYALILFLSFRVFAPIVVWLARIIGLGFYKIGRKLDLIKINHKDVSIEKPVLR